LLGAFWFPQHDCLCIVFLVSLHCFLVVIELFFLLPSKFVFLVVIPEEPALSEVEWGTCCCRCLSCCHPVGICCCPCSFSDSHNSSGAHRALPDEWDVNHPPTTEPLPRFAFAFVVALAFLLLVILSEAKNPRILLLLLLLFLLLFFLPLPLPLRLLLLLPLPLPLRLCLWD
jgi:hypothetical protein